ncbi:hypothetical protein F2Q69_00006631 [Brassica cretica]|uniref:Uncharacterized protein n=1 Tax=Brassica cretica TaxID=69181 RepID=A0A3N6RR88_BRACR|nr:hypothetical protein F2Q69_00006631 [Brassica cretica]
MRFGNARLRLVFIFSSPFQIGTPSLSVISELKLCPRRPRSLAASSRRFVTTRAWDEPSWRASSSSQPSLKGENREFWFKQSGSS